MAASQRVRSRVPAPQRSILPSVSGIPAWAAVLIAVACTFTGFLIDAGGDGGELTGTFAALYVAGCVVAVATVRYRGLFTAMVLPPLLLFVAVPLSYQQLTGRSTSGLKDILLNLVIPLVDRFPTMFLATALTIGLGGLRVYLNRRGEAEEQAEQTRRDSSWGRSGDAEERPRAAKDSRTGGSQKSKGRPPAKKSGAAKSRTPAKAGAGAKRAEAARPETQKGDQREPARRPQRPRPEPIVDLADQKTDKYEPPRPGGPRPPDHVADKPPRANGNRPREEQRGRAPRPAAAGARAEHGEGAAQRRGPRGEMPPHPRPNVRYRERPEK